MAVSARHSGGKNKLGGLLYWELDRNNLGIRFFLYFNLEEGYPFQINLILNDKFKGSFFPLSIV